MFWKYNNPSSSQIETILAKQDVTLQEVMDEEDILNECKVQNRLLIEFLIKPEILQELVTLTITEPVEDVDERTRFKYAYIACEMITCDIPSLNERLAGDETLLAKLYAFLDKEPPLNPLLASFFSKIMAVLIAKQTEQNWLSNQFTCLQVLDFLKAKDNFVNLLLNHLSTSAIMDLTLKLMTQVKGSEVRQNILNYLDSQRIIQNLVALLDPKVESARHHNVAQLLCDFIRETRENEADPLLNALESPDTVALLLDHILGEEKSESAIVAGVEVLLELLSVNKSSIPMYDTTNSYCNANYDDANDNDAKNRVVESTMKEILKRLRDIHNLLIDPPSKSAIATTVGTLSPPLGNTRLHVAKLLAAVIHCGGEEMAQELISLGTMDVLLDLFFAFPWNNFLHTQVQACILAALNKTLPSEQGDNIALSKHLLVNCKLVERILGAWKENEEKTTSPQTGVRQGYMGHLINIANYLVRLCTDSPIGIMLKDNSPEVSAALKTFNETSLAERNQVHDTLLGGVSPHNINDDSDEYREIPFAASGASQQCFQFFEYQSQQMPLNSFDSCGYNDDEFEFKDGEDALQSIEHRSGMNFDISDGDLLQQHELFKQVCAQTINTLDDPDEQIFEDKDHTFQTVIEKEAEQNSSSGSEEDGDDPIMEAEFWNPPNEANEAPAVIMSVDPWSAKESSNEETNSGWADFSTAVTFEAKFDGCLFTKSEPCVESASDLKVENIEQSKEREAEAIVDAIITTTKTEETGETIDGKKGVEVEVAVVGAQEEQKADVNVGVSSENATDGKDVVDEEDDNSAPQIEELKKQIEVLGPKKNSEVVEGAKKKDESPGIESKTNVEEEQHA